MAHENIWFNVTKEKVDGILFTMKNDQKKSKTERFNKWCFILTRHKHNLSVSLVSALNKTGSTWFLVENVFFLLINIFFFFYKKALSFCTYINILFLWLNILAGIQTLRSQKRQNAFGVSCFQFGLFFVKHWKVILFTIVFFSLLILTNWNFLKWHFVPQRVSFQHVQYSRWFYLIQPT